MNKLFWILIAISLSLGALSISLAKAEVPGYPTLALICKDAAMMETIANELEQARPLTADVAIAQDVCRAFPMPPMIPAFFERAEKIGETRQDWEGDPFAVYTIVQPDGKIYTYLVYNPDVVPLELRGRNAGTET